MILTQEVAILKSQDQVARMLDFVRHAVREGLPIDQVERGLWSRLLALGHAMLEGFVQAQGTGDLGPTIEHEGRIVRRLEHLHDRRYVSIFGELTIHRHVYGTRETQKHELVPLDARLNLPEGEFSYVLQDWDQHLAVKGPYAEARETVQEILGLGQSVRSLEDMNLSMSRQVESFRESRPTPPADEEEAFLVLTSDGKGVPMRKEEMAKTGRRQKGEKANQKRMACVGAVYTIAPFVRNADDVVDEVMRQKARNNRPVPQHKEVRAELTRPIDGQEVNGKDRIFAWFQEQVAARNPGLAKPMVCVMDGERALWKMLATYLVGIVCILDIFHVLERLWQAAHCFHAENSDEAKAFVTERLKKLLEGKVGYVIGGLKQRGYKQGLKGAKLKKLESAIGYLENNRRFMQYDEYLAAGYPIGSGVAEGTCRHLVKDRMERTGMRWQVPTAQAMLDLRAVHVSDQWAAFQSYRVEAERDRLYPYQATVESLWPAMVG